MKHCAVMTVTESGDSDVHLIQWSYETDITDFLLDRMDEELAYVCEVKVDSGESAEMDDYINSAIKECIEEMQEDL